MRRLAAAIAGVIATAAAAGAQQASQDVASASGVSMGDLASRDYEIKAAAQNGSRYVVFMQNDKSAYACEFVNVTTTRCRQIN